MFLLDKLNIEIKIVIGFGIIAFFLSLLIGFASGIEVSTVFLRSFVMVIIFSGIGYCVITIIKRFVPEVYNLILGQRESKIDVDIDKEESSEEIISGESNIEEMDEAEFQDSDKVNLEGKENKFSELTDEQFEHIGETDSESDSKPESTGKLGKHIVVNEDIVKYEPKLMAEAVRTMLSKDEK